MKKERKQGQMLGESRNKVIIVISLWPRAGPSGSKVNCKKLETLD